MKKKHASSKLAVPSDDGWTQYRQWSLPMVYISVLSQGISRKQNPWKQGFWSRCNLSVLISLQLLVTASANFCGGHLRFSGGFMSPSKHGNHVSCRLSNACLLAQNRVETSNLFLDRMRSIELAAIFPLTLFQEIWRRCTSYEDVHNKQSTTMDIVDPSESLYGAQK
jgi:hypothetical protein